MRKLFCIVAFAATLFPFTGVSQTELRRGTVRYEMSGMTAEPDAGPSVFTVFFKPDTVMTIVSLPTGEEALSVLYDYKEFRAYMIFRDKKRALVTPVSIEELAVGGAEIEDFALEDSLTETKVILGHVCRAVHILPKESTGSTQSIKAWVTDDIVTPFRIANGLEDLLGGFPLEIEFTLGVEESHDHISYRAVEIRDSAPDAVFLLPK
jgi:hypothetical protein